MSELPPDAVLVLGGVRARELAACALATALEVPLVIVSSGEASFAEVVAALPRRGRLLWDRRAVCTVTNFTCVAQDLAEAGVTSVCVATSRGHLRRATRVGRIVLGAVGICLHEAYTVDDGGGDEGLWRLARDVARALLWRVSGVDGRRVALWLHPERQPGRLLWIHLEEKRAANDDT